MGLYENMQTEHVGRMNLRTPVTAIATDSGFDAVSAMRKAKLGCTIILNRGRPIGLYTEAMVSHGLAHQGTRDPE